LGSSGRAVEQLPEWGPTPLEAEPLSGSGAANAMATKTTVAHARTASTAGIDLNRRNDIIGRRIVELIKLNI
jgi:hypothetical protein